jgi:hypothetical protein
MTSLGFKALVLAPWIDLTLTISLTPTPLDSSLLSRPYTTWV